MLLRSCVPAELGTVTGGTRVARGASDDEGVNDVPTKRRLVARFGRSDLEMCYGSQIGRACLAILASTNGTIRPCSQE